KSVAAGASGIPEVVGNSIGTWAFSLAPRPPSLALLQVHRVLLQLIQADVVERALVGGGQHDLRRRPGLEGLAPTGRAQAPAVSGLEAGKSEIRHGRAEVVAASPGELEEFRGHQRADRVHAAILGPGVAAAVSEKPGQRLGGAFGERPAQHVASLLA